MNFVVISPNYPESYWMFCRGLKENGAKVLAIVDTPYNHLNMEKSTGLNPIMKLGLI